MTQVAICWNDDHPTTPLILTFKWPKKEFWCPACGALYGYMSPDSADETPELMAEHDEMKERAKPFLTGETDAWEYSHPRS